MCAYSPLAGGPRGPASTASVLQRRHRRDHAHDHGPGRSGLRPIAQAHQPRRAVPARQHHHRLCLAHSPVRPVTGERSLPGPHPPGKVRRPARAQRPRTPSILRTCRRSRRTTRSVQSPGNLNLSPQPHRLGGYRSSSGTRFSTRFRMAPRVMTCVNSSARAPRTLPRSDLAPRPAMIDKAPPGVMSGQEVSWRRDVGDPAGAVGSRERW
jgi:hypothetical protein